MKIMGIYPGGHDPAVCLLRDGQVQVMIEDERLTRVKHGVYGPLMSLWSKHNQRFGFFPWASVSYCLRAAGLSMDDLDAIVVPHWGRQDCQIVPPLGEDADGGFDWAEFLPVARDKIIVADEPWGGSHHLMHGMSAFYASPFERAAVLVIDAAGSFTSAGAEAETGYVFEDRAGRWREVFKNRYPSMSMPTGGDDSSPSLRRKVETSIGYMYEQASGVLGFVNTAARVADAGKTMGLAPYGGPTPELGEPWVTSDGFALDFSNLYRYAFSSGLYERYSFADRSNALIQNENDISPFARNLAWKVQAELEKAVLHLASELQRVTGAEHLCLSGGVALNSVANGQLLRNGVFKEIFVQPAAADSGQALGLAYYGHLKLGSKTPIKAIRNAFGGRSHERGEVAALLDGNLTVTELPNDDALCDDAAHELAMGRIVGWFQGGSEYGPRSLGHRSILADPRPVDMKDHLNGRVKFRESFRPFAPSVLLDRCHEVFELEQESPYMLFVAPVRPEWQQRIPAVTHVDGTARIQTVTRESDPLFHQLISSFSRKTEVPLLLNTSFNLRGMPIVETPRDALQCFLLTDMDALYLGRFKVQAPTLEQMLLRVSRAWHLEASAGAAFQHGDGAPSHSFVSSTADGEVRRIEIGPVKLFTAFSQALVGDRSARDILATALNGVPSTLEVERATLEFVRRMLRAGVFSIRVGQHWMTA